MHLCISVRTPTRAQNGGTALTPCYIQSSKTRLRPVVRSIQSRRHEGSCYHSKTSRRILSLAEQIHRLLHKKQPYKNGKGSVSIFPHGTGTPSSARSARYRPIRGLLRATFRICTTPTKTSARLEYYIFQRSCIRSVGN